MREHVVWVHAHVLVNVRFNWRDRRKPTDSRLFWLLPAQNRERRLRCSRRVRGPRENRKRWKCSSENNLHGPRRLLFTLTHTSCCFAVRMGIKFYHNDLACACVDRKAPIPRAASFGPMNRCSDKTPLTLLLVKNTVWKGSHRPQGAQTQT